MLGFSNHFWNRHINWTWKTCSWLILGSSQIGLPSNYEKSRWQLWSWVFLCLKFKAWATLAPLGLSGINLETLLNSFDLLKNYIYIFFRWNPFRKKSGIMGVLYAQSKRNRVVSKHGKLNTFVRPDEKEEQHR